MKISKETERRFVLGLQGLWPGRRWKGRAGIRAALSACRQVQVDPLDVVGQNQDLVFASRVADYRSEDLRDLLYTERAGFEFGGFLCIRPRESLGLQWSWVQNEGLPVRWEKWGRANASVVRRVRRSIDENGPQSAQDWADGERTDDYRSSRIEGVALYYLWRRLEVLIHHRDGNRKVFDRTDRLLGPLPKPFSRRETRDRTALETLGWLGLSGRWGISHLRTQEDGRGRSRLTKAKIRQGLIDSGRLATVDLEGERTLAVLRSDCLPLLEEVAAGDVPRAWKPISEEPEAVLLAPLDIVAARGRAQNLFGFDLLFEVYKPAAERRWGYYVLPVLLGDRLIGRVEPTFDRSSGEFCLSRAWWEPGVVLRNVVEPFARAVVRTVAAAGGSSVVVGAVGPGAFRSQLKARLRTLPAS